MVPDALLPLPLPHSLPPGAPSSKPPLSRRPTSPKPSKRVTPSAKAACPSIIFIVRKSSPSPVEHTKCPSTACTPLPNPPPTENHAAFDFEAFLDLGLFGAGGRRGNYGTVRSANSTAALLPSLRRSAKLAFTRSQKYVKQRTNRFSL